MNSEWSYPPALAVWLLRRLCPKRNREAITGDLIERFPRGALRRLVLASSFGRNPGWRFRPIEIVLDGDPLCCSRHGFDLVLSMGADLPDCDNDHIDELGATIAMAYRNRNHNGSDSSAALRCPFLSLENIWLG